MEYKYDIALSFATEEQQLVDKVYHYLKREGMKVFFAPAPECQIDLSAENQREVFYGIFGIESEFVALFISENYIKKEVPIEEASIALAKHRANHTVIPICIDGTKLPEKLLDYKQTNYFREDNAAVIAMHLAEKIKQKKNKENKKEKYVKGKVEDTHNVMNIIGNQAEKQNFIYEMKGNITL